MCQRLYPYDAVSAVIDNLERFLHATLKDLPGLRAKGVNGDDFLSDAKYQGPREDLQACKDRDLLSWLQLLGRACEERGIDSAAMDRFQERWMDLHRTYPDLWDALTNFSEFFPNDFLFGSLRPTVFRLQKVAMNERDAAEAAKAPAANADPTKTAPGEDDGDDGVVLPIEDDPADPRLNHLQEAFLSAPELARLFGLTEKRRALQNRLSRWRPSHMDGQWKREKNPKVNTPRFLYRVRDVLPIIQEMGGRLT